MLRLEHCGKSNTWSSPNLECSNSTMLLLAQPRSARGYFPLWVGPRRRNPWEGRSMPLGNQSTPDDRIWRSGSRRSIGWRKCQSNRLLSDVTRDVIQQKTLPGTIMTNNTPLWPCHLTNSTRVIKHIYLLAQLLQQHVLGGSEDQFVLYKLLPYQL